MKNRYTITALIVAILSLQIVMLSAEESGEAQIEGSTEGIGWGRHWGGTELLGPISLRGKVVLLKIWGG